MLLTQPCCSKELYLTDIDTTSQSVHTAMLSQLPYCVQESLLLGHAYKSRCSKQSSSKFALCCPSLQMATEAQIQQTTLCSASNQCVGGCSSKDVLEAPS